jgi:regulatory protein
VRAYSYALKLLTKKDYSEHRLREKLHQKGFSAEDVQLSLEKLKAQKFLNDDRFKEFFVRKWIRKGYGDYYIIHKGRQESLSISKNDIAQQRKELILPEETVMQKLAQKKQSLKDSPEKVKRRILSLLDRRGFGSKSFEYQVEILPPQEPAE